MLPTEPTVVTCWQSVGELLADVEVMPPNTNRRGERLTVSAPAITVDGQHRTTSTCADAVLDACTAVARRTGEPVIRITDVVAELGATDGDYAPNTIYKTIRELTRADAANGYQTGLKRLDWHQLFVVSCHRP